MLELLFLLLPVAAAYGWYMGRRSAGHQHQRDVKDYSKSYSAGLNYLLSDQPDKAVDQFIALVEVDQDTIETHLALGRLFRQRGEIDRSIRVHQNLLARPSLSPEHHETALYELANDYLQAGLIDRCIDLFADLATSDVYGDKSLGHLLSIYQSTKEWGKAITVAKKMITRGQQSIKVPLAHFYCELAQCTDDKKQSLSLLKQGLKVDENCVRARLAIAQSYLDANKLTDCQLLLDQLLGQDIDYFREVLPLFIECYQRRDQQDGLLLKLDDALEKGAGIATLLAKIEIMRPKLSQQQVERQITEHLVSSPSIKGFFELMNYQLADAEEGRAKESLQHLNLLVGEQLKLKPVYRCHSCGFEARSIHWQCPSCLSWGCIKPIRGIDGD
jgi:lipopolysaccharide biosynthesis regulator YciM